MEYVPGIKITNVEALDAKGIDRQKLVIDVHKVFFTMLLRHSIFHADPHPGNISVSDDGSLILYDYGMVGRLDNETRLRLIRLYLALIEKDPPRTVNAMNDLGMLMPEFNRSVIERAIEMAIRGMHGRKPSEMEVKALLEIANKTMSRFPFILPKNLALYMRMTSIIEGIYKTHKVDFKFVNDLKKFIDENRSLQLLNSKPKSNALLSGSILSSAIFVGSAFLYSSNDVVGIIGMVGALIIMGIFTIFRKS